MPYYLSPVGNDQQTDANGNPLVGGKIYTYLAGTSTPAATYTDSTSGTSQANPIILNSLGLPASPIWMLGGQALKFIFKDSADVLIRTVDNITGINDATLLITSSEWVLSGSLPTYISATSFSLVGDQTGLFQVARRMKSTNSGGTIYSTIAASVYAANATTVTVVNDSGVLDAGLSAVSYGLLAAINPSVAAAITQTPGDNSTKVATTAWAKAYGGLIGAQYPASYTTSATLATSDLHRPVYFNSASAGTITLPASAIPGQAVSVYNLGTGVLTLARGGTYVLNAFGFVSVTSVNIGSGDSLCLVFDGGSWIQVFGAAQLGVGQTWQNVTASRAVSTTYTNSTGKPIQVLVSASTTNSGSAFTVNGLPAITWAGAFYANPTTSNMAISVIIPIGNTYSCSAFTSWYELR